MNFKKMAGDIVFKAAEAPYYKLPDALIEPMAIEIESALRQAWLEGARKMQGKNSKIAEDHYEDHCCEDCPCSSWRENVAKIIRSINPETLMEEEK